ncbi:MAG TPA: 4-hydroxybenzoate octaprenyltransferase [Planctomycetota bacterium]|nr:4-hydroxybenzoate octaprenyltransferase [Planctomycetota bacterium]
MLQRLSIVLDSIKFAHSIFALPFALLAMIVAAGGLPPPLVIALIVVCMVAGRSAAMAFNRLADRDIDATNPRTKTRPSVTGAVSPKFLLGFILVCAAIFVAAAGALNTVCLILALPVLAILLGYSLSKRFTPLCHFWLGLSLGLAPLGAHLAVRGDLQPIVGLAERWGFSFELFPILLGATVLCWVAGFDLIYACQDYEIDLKDPRVRSLPKSIGVANALRVSSLLHFIAVALLIACGIYASMGIWYYVAVALVSALLVYEHWIVSPTDLSRVNVAFFTINGVVSLLLFAAVLIERVIIPALHA